MATDITSLLEETVTIEPASDFCEKARFKTEGAYEQLYRQSIEDPEGFWAREAEELSWIKPFTEVLDYKAGERCSWFAGGQLNVSANCLDRHLNSWRRTKAAIIWQGEDPSEKRTLTYQQLHVEVCRCANVLKRLGVEKGSVVTLYLPMIPELTVAMLACARIGAIHSVVFSAFSASALRERIGDCGSTFVVTADGGTHAGKEQRYKERVDDALVACPSVEKVLVVRRSGCPVEMGKKRDFWWDEEMQRPRISTVCPPEVMESEDPLFILYTSGSTGAPKGVLHTSAGYLLYASLTFRTIFDHRDDDVFWCTADCGWITGHSYVVYGPLANGATVLMYEGAPTYPLPDRFWQTIEEHRVSVFYTAPTAIRALMRLGDEWPQGKDLSSLRLLGSVGEPINSEAWLWYHRIIGAERCPIVDTWWQTETGGILLTTLPGAHAMKPGAAGHPFFGIQPEILDEAGQTSLPGQGGALTIAKPWPGMIRGVYGDPSGQRIRDTYFSRYPGRYFSADSARKDDEGYYWLMGRMDDVVNVAAHRFSTAEIESALGTHGAVAESAVVGIPDETKGQAIYCFVTLKSGQDPSDELRAALIQQVRTRISPVATPHAIHFAQALPKTRSGKIMRRILRQIAVGDTSDLGDTSTLADPSVIQALLDGA